jgi:hypothetical protein
MSDYTHYRNAKLKVEWGKRHIENLGRLMARMTLQDRPELVIEPDGDTGRQLLVLKSEMPAPPPMFPSLLEMPSTVSAPPLITQCPNSRRACEVLT